jgi:hypothetical protein
MSLSPRIATKIRECLFHCGGFAPVRIVELQQTFTDSSAFRHLFFTVNG